MAVSCEPQSLMTDSRCFACLNSGQLAIIQTYTLAVMAGVSTDPQVLMRAANCFVCLTPNQLGIINTYLLCQIANGSGGGGATSGVTCSASSAPSGVPTGNCGIWVKLDTSSLYVYNSGSGNWDQIL